MIFYLISMFSEGSMSGWGIFAFILAYFLAILFAMTVHEFSHAFVATKMGDDTPRLQGRLTLNSFAHISGFGMLSFFLIGFGWANPIQTNPLKYKNYRKGMALVSLAGVTANLISAFLFSAGVFYMSYFVDLAQASLLVNFFYYFFLYGFLINIALFVFNLIPVYPLDGFNFIRSFMKPGNKFEQFMYRYGNIFLIIIILSPLYDILYSYVFSYLLAWFSMFWGLFI